MRKPFVNRPSDPRAWVTDLHSGTRRRNIAQPDRARHPSTSHSASSDPVLPGKVTPPSDTPSFHDTVTEPIRSSLVESAPTHMVELARAVDTVKDGTEAERVQVALDCEHMYQSADNSFEEYQVETLLNMLSYDESENVRGIAEDILTDL